MEEGAVGRFNDRMAGAFAGVFMLGVATLALLRCDLHLHE